MSNLMRYRPQFPSNSYHDEFVTSLDRIFNDLFRDVFPASSGELGVDLFSKGAYPKVNVVDEENRIVIEAEIPGLGKDQVHVEVLDGILKIRGEKKATNETGGKKNYVYRELKQSSFVRSFQLNDNLDAEKIDAKFENGMLEIAIPKKVPDKDPQPREITIK